MLLILIQIVSVETRATVAAILSKLNNLQSLMASVDQDIGEFNNQVEALIEALRARAVPVPNIMTQLIDAYKACQDQTFVDYIKTKADNYFDGTITLTPESLMQLGLEKFKILVVNDDWKRKSEAELQFIAMKATLEKLQQLTPIGDNDSSKESSKPKKDDKTPSWKKVAPEDNEPHEKTVKGRDYIYCPHHGTTKWVLKVNSKGVDHKTGCTVRLAHEAQHEQSQKDNTNEQESDDESL
jgi:hypothetical protein